MHLRPCRCNGCTPILYQVIHCTQNIHNEEQQYKCNYKLKFKHGRSQHYLSFVYWRLWRKIEPFTLIRINTKLYDLRIVSKGNFPIAACKAIFYINLTFTPFVKYNQFFHLNIISGDDDVQIHRKKTKL